MSGHIQRVRYTIESSERAFAPTYKITALMRCEQLLGVKMERLVQTADFENDVVVLGLANRLEKRVKKHLKGCKTCRIAKKKMKALRSTTARA